MAGITVLSNIQTRFNMAWHALTAKAAPRAAQSAVMMFPSWHDGQPQWHMQDLQTYVREGYNMNALIHDAVSYKSRALMQAPQRAFGESMESPVRQLPNHPLSKLLARPNPYQSQAEYQQIRMTYLNLAGNAYTYLQREKAGALPIALWTLRPDWVYIIPDSGGGVKGYLYRPDGYVDNQAVPILPEDMIHIKFPNPGDPMGGLGYGLSPLMPIARSADVDNEITLFLKKFFENKTMIGGVLKFNIPMDEKTVAIARKRWQDVYGGVENWGNVAVLDQGGEYQRIAMTFKEMDFSVIDKRNETRILGPFGVPGILIETLAGLEHATYANKREARVMFWEDTMKSEITLFDSDDQYYLTDAQDGVFPMHDLSGVSALQKNVPELVNAAKTMFDMGTPRDVAYRTVGLNVPSAPDGQRGYLPNNLVPAEMLPILPSAPTAPAPLAPAVAPETPSTAPTAEEEQTALEDTATVVNDAEEGKALNVGKNRFSEEQKQYIWKAVDSIASSHENAFRETARAAFEADKRAILALVTEAKKKALERKASVEWLTLEESINQYLLDSSVPDWRERFVPVMSAVIEDTGNYWSAQTGFAFNVRNILGEAWFADYRLRFAQAVSETTSSTIHDILAQGQAEGWSIPQMQARLTQTFEQWMNGGGNPEDFDWLTQRMPPYRTELIARTETLSSSNAGAHAAFTNWNVRSRSYLSTRDDRTRDTHLQAELDNQNVPIDEPFTVGGYSCMYPGDPSLPIGERANCRCTTLPDIN